MISTGTPEGVEPLKYGDTVRIEVEQIGEFTVNVEHADGGSR